MQAPERSAERDAAIAALLPNVPFDGWTHRALRAALATSGQCPDDAELLFPGGASDMVEACFDWVDRQMEAAAAADPTLAGLRVSQRVRAVIAPPAPDAPAPRGDAPSAFLARATAQRAARGGDYGAHCRCDLARRRRQRRGFLVVYEARPACRGVERDPPLLAVRHDRGGCRDTRLPRPPPRR